jgi:hypothetical protein
VDSGFEVGGVDGLVGDVVVVKIINGLIIKT